MIAGGYSNKWCSFSPGIYALSAWHSAHPGNSSAAALSLFRQKLIKGNLRYQGSIYKSMKAHPWCQLLSVLSQAENESQEQDQQTQVAFLKTAPFVSRKMSFLGQYCSISCLAGAGRHWLCLLSLLVSRRALSEKIIKTIISHFPVPPDNFLQKVEDPLC